LHILLFGATGRVGSSVIDFALAGDHSVTAIVRTRAKIQREDPRLTVIEGDIYKPETLIAPMQSGIDVVVNVVGGDVFKPSTVVTDSAHAILATMKQYNVTRYVAISGVAQMPACDAGVAAAVAGLRQSPFRFGVIDHDGAFAEVTASDCDWTLVGCPYIPDGGDHTAKYQITPGCFPGGNCTISPQDVANFIVKEAVDHRYSKQIVGIWY